ncbi:hypothetical protein DHODJN_03750 [Methylorubrum extorquens]
MLENNARDPVYCIGRGDSLQLGLEIVCGI